MLRGERPGQAVAARATDSGASSARRDTRASASSNRPGRPQGVGVHATALRDCSARGPASEAASRWASSNSPMRRRRLDEPDARRAAAAPVVGARRPCDTPPALRGSGSPRTAGGRAGTAARHRSPGVPAAPSARHQRRHAQRASDREQAGGRRRHTHPPGRVDQSGSSECGHRAASTRPRSAPRVYSTSDSAPR